jgi:hypothetical protein
MAKFNFLARFHVSRRIGLIVASNSVKRSGGLLDFFLVHQLARL